MRLRLYELEKLVSVSCRQPFRNVCAACRDKSWKMCPVGRCHLDPPREWTWQNTHRAGRYTNERLCSRLNGHIITESILATYNSHIGTRDSIPLRQATRKNALSDVQAGLESLGDKSWVLLLASTPSCLELSKVIGKPGLLFMQAAVASGSSDCSPTLQHGLSKQASIHGSPRTRLPRTRLKRRD
jgi:hypothetical protein